MKITIAQNSIQLVFFPETKFRFNFNNPIFSDDGAFNFPFDIPVEENRAALAFVDKLAIDTVDVKILVYIESATINSKRAYLFVTPTNDVYQCNLVLNEGLLYNDINNKLISELTSLSVNMGANMTEFITSANTLITKSFPDADFNFPLMKCDAPYDNEVMNERFKFINFFKWTDVSPSFVINDIATGFVPLILGQIYLTQIHNVTSYIPCPYVFAVLKNILDKLQYNSTGNVFDDDAINQLMFIHNKTIDQIPTNNTYYICKLAMLEDYDIYHDSEVIIDHFVPFRKSSPSPLTNPGPPHYNNADGRYYYPIDETTIIQVHVGLNIRNNNTEAVTIELKVNVSKLLDSNTLFYFDSNPVEQQIPAGETVYFEKTIIVTVTGDYKYISVNIGAGPELYDITCLTENSYLDIIPVYDSIISKPYRTFNLNQYLPNITIKTLLDDLKHLFGIILFIENENASFQFFKDIYSSSPVLDLTPYLLYDYEKEDEEKIKSISFPSGFDNTQMSYQDANGFQYSTITGQIRFDQTQGHFYRNDHDDYWAFKWERYLQDLNLMSFGDEGTDIAISASIPEIIIANHDWTVSTHWLPCPKLTSSIISPFNKTNEEPEYMLAFWRGMINDSSGDAYPLATPWIYRIGNALIDGATTALRFSGDNGLYENYLKEYIDLHNKINNILKVEMNLPKGIVSQLQKDKTYTINNIKVLIKSWDYETDVDDNIIQPVTLELVKL